MTTITEVFNGFWYITILALLFIALAGILAYVSIKLKHSDNGLFNNIFNRHADEHENTTAVIWDIAKEKELHTMERKIKDLDDALEILSERIKRVERYDEK